MALPFPWQHDEAAEHGEWKSACLGSCRDGICLATKLASTMNLWSIFMKAFPIALLMSALTLTAGIASAQAQKDTTNPQSGHPNTGEASSQLGQPAAGASGSTGGSRTPGTSASGAATKCPDLTMHPSDGANPNQGTGRNQGPKLARKESGSASNTYCADETAASSGSSGASGGSGDTASSTNSANSGSGPGKVKQSNDNQKGAQ
ncbi:hypothetical protein ACFQUU_19260 [Herbaspirillum sp. GCM10030257]|uniref:hypothetical protein n=1 Tax=Herbaspirillum sp. GCM10030257 TaxID=3273393 RepID=UPI003620C901